MQRTTRGVISEQSTTPAESDEADSTEQQESPAVPDTEAVTDTQAVTEDTETVSNTESILPGEISSETEEDKTSEKEQETESEDKSNKDEKLQSRSAADTDAVFAGIKSQMETDIPAGSSKNTYSQNYQSMEEEKFNYSYGTGTATVNNGLTMEITGLKDNLFVGRWENSPYMSSGIIDVTFRFSSVTERIGFTFKSADDYKGVSFRYDVTDTKDTSKASWVLQNDESGEYDSVSGPALTQNTEYRLRVAFHGKHVVAALGDEIIFNKENCNSMTDTAVQTLGQAGIYKRYSADARMMISNLNIQGIGTASKPVVLYTQDYEGTYTPNWSNGTASVASIAVQQTENGNHVLKIPSGVQRVYDMDSPKIKEGTLSLRYKAVAKDGGTPKQFGFRFGVTDGNEGFREINWDGGRWVVENETGWPGIDMQKPISGTWNDLCINFVEGSATIFLNKEEVGTYELDALKDAKSGRFGIRSWGSTEVLIDDLTYTSELISPDPVRKYVNNFEDSITGGWDKGSASIVSEGNNKVLKLDGLNGETALLNDKYAVDLAEGTYLLKVKTEDAKIGLQFGGTTIKYEDGGWKAIYGGVTKPIAPGAKDANILAPKLRSWNNIGISVLGNKVDLSINGNNASAVFDGEISTTGTLGISGKSVVYVDDITYTEQFL